MPVPKAFAQRLKALFGTDRFGDANVRVRFDAKRFLEGCWVVEEKWAPEAFGDIRDWNKTKVMYEDGIRHDFGDFPSRGLYASVMVWCDAEGRTLPLNDALIERLCFQKQQREIKNIPAEQVALDVAAKEALVERQQFARRDQAIIELSDGLKKDKEKIVIAASRVQSLPQTVKAKNILPLN